MVTCGLTACISGSAPGPTLGIEYVKPLPLLSHPERKDRQPLNGLDSGTTGVSRCDTKKFKPIRSLMKQEMTGWQWHQLDHVCKSSAPRSRQITMPSDHHSFFTGRMLFLTPTNSVKALKASSTTGKIWYYYVVPWQNCTALCTALLC